MHTPQNADLLLALARHIFEYGVEGHFYSKVLTHHHEGGIEHWARQGRPVSCPSCGSPRVARVLYGLPACSAELDLALSQGIVILGGWVVSDDDPAFTCLDCGTAIPDAAGGRATVS